MTTKPNLIGIAGFARSGKDTIGAYLAERHGYQRSAFADKLRELAYELDGVIDVDLPGHSYETYARAIDHLGYEEAKRRYPDLRDHLVALGAGARKVLGPDVWLDALLPRPVPGFEALSISPFDRIVVSDVRYVNEAKRIQALGGTLVYVSRSAVTAANGEEAQSLSRVLAECAPIVHLYNNGTLEDLYAQVEARLVG